MIIDKIQSYIFDKKFTIEEAIRYEIEKIAGASFKRQFMEENDKDATGKLWFSSLGKCARQVAFGYHGVEKAGKEIDGRAKMIFWMGDLIELTIVCLAKLAGCNIIATGLQQTRVSLPINGDPEKVVSGRPDGLLIDSKEILLVEVKSMSSFAFDRFEREGEAGLDQSYIVQVNLGMEACGVKRCVVVGFNKDNGVMHEIIIEKTDAALKIAADNVKAILASTPETLPPPPASLDFDPKTRFYPWQCLYCAYWMKCRTNAEKVVVRGSYKLQEKKLKTEPPPPEEAKAETVMPEIQI